MIIVLTGSLGQGKTFSMSVLGSLLARAGDLDLYSNYGLKDSTRIWTTKELLNTKNGVLCFDEVHMSIDSRFWKDNVELTHFMLQTRKLGLIVLMTTQQFGQVDLRVRGITDYIVICRKTYQGFWLQFVDWQERKICHRRLIPKETAKKFFHLYNTNELVNSISAGKKRYGKN